MLLDRLAAEKELEVREELEFAILDQDMDQIQQLVRENPLLVNVRDGNGQTPLYFAAREANMEASRFLLANHAAVDTKDRWGRTPLFAAIYEEPLVLDRAPIVTLLIESGADLNATDDMGNTPLHMAAFGETEIVKLLLEQGADVNAVNDAGETPLHKAVQYPEYEIVRELLRHGADKNRHNAQGLTPMQIAEERGWAILVELLKSAAVEREEVR